jgi:uncharacterized protein YjbI with pentapeptide repeats
MADSDSPPPEDASRCGVHEEARRGCAGLPTYHRVDGTPYCVLHAPRPDKMAAFQRALSEKLERRDWNFAAVWFPADQSFYKVEFGVADFSFATFNGNARFSSASFGRVEFGRTVFKANAFFGWEVSFRSDATFFETVFEGEADFGSAHFKGAYFHGTRFARHASFHSAVFDEMAAFSATFEGDVDFSLARFARRGTFRDSRFAGGVRFFGNDAYPVFLPESVMSFADTRFAKPELVSFENVTLRPHWFVGADAKAIVFTNVEWRGTLVDEINGARAALAQAPHRVVEQACNRLAVNAENNQRYDEASRFR